MPSLCCQKSGIFLIDNELFNEMYLPEEETKENCSGLPMPEVTRKDTKIRSQPATQ